MLDTVLVPVCACFLKLSALNLFRFTTGMLCFSQRIFEFFEGEMPKESYAYMGSDDPAPGMGGFSDVAIRRGFIRKVRIYQGRGFGEIRIRNCLTDHPDRGVRRILWGGGGGHF